MTDFYPSGSQNPLTDVDETWHGWLRAGLGYGADTTFHRTYY